MHVSDGLRIVSSPYESLDRRQEKKLDSLGRIWLRHNRAPCPRCNKTWADIRGTASTGAGRLHCRGCGYNYRDRYKRPVWTYPSRFQA